MKKMICMLLVLCMLMTLVACSVQKSEVPGKDTVAEQVKQISAEKTDADESCTKEVEIPLSECIRYGEARSILKEDDTLAKPVVLADRTAIQLDDCRYLHFSNKAELLFEDSIAYPFAVLSENLRANPLANFQRLMKAGYYEKTDVEEKQEKNLTLDYSTDIGYEGFVLHSLGDVSAKRYAYTTEGCSDFLSDLQNLLNKNDDNIDSLLDPENLPEIKANFSKKDNCYYIYTLIYQPDFSTALAIYLKSSDGKYVTSAEFQLLRIYVPYGDCSCGIGLTMNHHRASYEFEVLCLMTSIEQLLTGTCYVEEVHPDNNFFDKKIQIPKSYSLTDYHATFALDEYYEIGGMESDGGYAGIYTYTFSK